VILRGRTGDPNTRDPRFQEVDSLGEGRNDRNTVPVFAHGRRSGTWSSSEDTTTSSRFVRPSAVPVSTPTFLEGVRSTADILKPSLAKPAILQRGGFRATFVGPTRPRSCPHPDFTSLDLRALQAFAQYVYPSRHLVCTNTHILRHCSRCLIATDTRE